MTRETLDFAVQIVERPANLSGPAQIYILSREAAKLGHGHAGVEGRCPRCDAQQVAAEILDAFKSGAVPQALGHGVAFM